MLVPDPARYTVRWERIPETNGPEEKGGWSEADSDSFAEAWDLFTSLSFQSGIAYVELRDGTDGDRWEFSSGWLDHYPRKGR